MSRAPQPPPPPPPADVMEASLIGNIIQTCMLFSIAFAIVSLSILLIVMAGR